MSDLSALFNIAALLAVIYLGSYALNRKRPNPAKDALFTTKIVGGAFIILGVIVYISIIIQSHS